jgi:hypothetical protein
MSVFRSERFLIYYIRHLRWVTAVVAFEHIDQPLDAAASHAFVGIDIKACDAGAAGEVMKHAAAIGDFGSSSGESGGSGSFSKTSSAAPAMTFSFNALASAFSSTTGPRELFTSARSASSASASSH